MNLKRILIILSLAICSLNSYASMYNSLTQTREEARKSYEIEREIARINNDRAKLFELENNINRQTRDTSRDHYNYRHNY